MADTEDKLSDAEKARIERNRQRALLLRQSRLATHPYKQNKDGEHRVVRVAEEKLIDTNGGFFLEKSQQPGISMVNVVQEFPPIIAGKPVCTECVEEFSDSFLLQNFDEEICDNCRDDRHTLVTKTDAKTIYLLKDCDLEKRAPPLRFIRRKNTRHNNWGDMHLYLKTQVEKRAMEVWESQEKLDEEQKRRTENKERLKRKKFNKKVQELRRAVRSSLYKKESTSHEHSYGPETYDETEDVYVKTCTGCGHTLSYEKM